MKESTTFELIDSVSLCVPAIRMVEIVMHWTDDGKINHYISPVVVLRCCVKRLYRKCGVHENPLSVSHEYLLEDGWKFDGSHDSVECLTVVDGGIDNQSGWHDNVILQYEACPWPVEQDEDRLKEIISDMKKDAASRIKRNVKESA